MKSEIVDPKMLMAEILSDGCEDYYGLYEIIWGLNTRYPDLNQEAKLAAAQVAISELLAREFVKIYRTVSLGRDYEAMPAAQCDDIVRDPTSWDPPGQDGPGSYFCFAATEAGEIAYHARTLDVS